MSEDMTPERARAMRYGRNDAIPYNASKCVEAVWDDHGFPCPYQCTRPNGHGSHGLYCKQHDPAERARRRQASIDKFNRKIASDREWRKWSALRDASLDELRAEIARREGKS